MHKLTMIQQLEQGRIIKVSPNLSLGVPLDKTTVNVIDASEWNANHEIDDEKRIKAKEDKDRYNIYKDILLGKPDDHCNYYHALYGLLAIVLSNLLCSIITVVPIHNVILEPFYWYEIVLQTAFGFVFACAAYMLLNCSYWMNINRIRKIDKFLKFYIFLCIVFSATGIIIILVWRDILGFIHPMPFSGIIILNIAIVLSFVGLWYLLPNSWRKNSEIWRSFKFFCLAIITNLFITLVYTTYTKVFTLVPEKWQWGAAIFLIPVREFNMWLQKKVSTKAAGVHATAVMITCGHNINTRHCFFLSVILGTVATDLTCWVLLAIDFSINMFLTIRVIWLRRNGVTEKNESSMVHIFMDLIIAETVELIVPFTYLTTFMIAYIGPNATLFGEVSSNMWHFSAVTDLEAFLKNVGMFLLADCVSATITITVMWYFARINVVRGFVNMQREFWLVMSLNTAYATSMVSLKSTRFNYQYISLKYFILNPYLSQLN